MPTGPAARITDFVIHPLLPLLSPGPAAFVPEQALGGPNKIVKGEATVIIGG